MVRCGDCKLATLSSLLALSSHKAEPRLGDTMRRPDDLPPPRRREDLFLREAQLELSKLLAEEPPKPSKDEPEELGEAS